MSLPVRATLDDIRDVGRYLSNKPTGATAAEIKRVLPKNSDTRKMAALKYWNLVEEVDGRITATSRGRAVGKNAEAELKNVARSIITEIEPYKAVTERAADRQDEVWTAADVGSYWHEHFRSECSASDEVLNEQAVCFFQLIEGAGLGKIVIGRKGSPTRIEFDLDVVQEFVGLQLNTNAEESSVLPQPTATRAMDTASESSVPEQIVGCKLIRESSRRVYISRHEDLALGNQLKELVTVIKLIPVTVDNQEFLSRDTIKRIVENMRSCEAGIIHITGNHVVSNEDGKSIRTANETALIEAGAAMALYVDKFVLLVRNDVELPKELLGLRECRYSGEQLTAEVMMQMLKAFGDFSLTA
jgi:predicted nucleotide-binding protein